MHYDYLFVGAGLFSATIANAAIKTVKNVLLLKNEITLVEIFIQRI